MRHSAFDDTTTSRSAMAVSCLRGGETATRQDLSLASSGWICEQSIGVRAASIFQSPLVSPRAVDDNATAPQHRLLAKLMRQDMADHY